MEFKKLIDRKNELDRITTSLKREDTQFVVVYGRRRIGKSTLLKHIVNTQEYNPKNEMFAERKTK